MRTRTQLEDWKRKTENPSKYVRYRSFNYYCIKKDFQEMCDFFKEMDLDVSQLQQKFDYLMHIKDAYDFGLDFYFSLADICVSKGIEAPGIAFYLSPEYVFPRLPNPESPDYNTSEGIKICNTFMDNYKTFLINKIPYDRKFIEIVDMVDETKQTTRLSQNNDINVIFSSLDKNIDNLIRTMNIPKYVVESIHYYWACMMTLNMKFNIPQDSIIFFDLQYFTNFYERHPEYTKDFNEALIYLSNPNIDEEDLCILFGNYNTCANSLDSKLELPSMDFGPDCESLPLYGGIFINGNEEQISNVKDVIQNSSKRIQAQFNKCISGTNKKLKKEIENIFYEFCKKEYMVRNVENLYIFTYILTKYTPFGKKIDMHPIFWGKPEENVNGTLKIRDKDKAVLYYFFAVAFKEIDGSKQSRLQHTKSLFCLDHSDPDHPIDEEVSDSDFPVYKGHPHRYIAYNDYSRIPSDMVKVINDFANNIKTLRKQCFDKLKKLPTNK